MKKSAYCKALEKKLDTELQKVGVQFNSGSPKAPRSGQITKGYPIGRRFKTIVQRSTEFLKPYFEAQISQVSRQWLHRE
jgi:hypothetical protein